MEMTTNLILTIGIVTTLILAVTIVVIPKLLGGATKKVTPSSDKEEKKEGKEEDEKNLNQAQKAWVWITDEKEPGRRAFIGWAVLFLILLSLPWVGAVVRFFWYLILMGGVAFWAINLWAEPKVRKERAGKSNKTIYRLATLALMAEGAIMFLVYSGADPAIFNPTSPTVKSLVGQALEKTTSTTQVEPARKKEFVFELPIKPGEWSSSFKDSDQGPQVLQALKQGTPGQTRKWKIEATKGEVEFITPEGVTGYLSEKHRPGLDAIKASEMKFKPKGGESGEVVRFTISY